MHLLICANHKNNKTSNIICFQQICFTKFRSQYRNKYIGNSISFPQNRDHDSEDKTEGVLFANE